MGQYLWINIIGLYIDIEHFCKFFLINFIEYQILFGKLNILLYKLFQTSVGFLL